MNIALTVLYINGSHTGWVLPSVGGGGGGEGGEEMGGGVKK